MESGPARKSVSRWQFLIQTTQMRSPRARPHSAPVTMWTVRHSCLCAAHLVPSLIATATWVAQCDASSQSALWSRPEPPCTTLASAALLCTRGRTRQWSCDRAWLLRLACLPPIPRIIFIVLEAKVPGLVPGRPHGAQGQWPGGWASWPAWPGCMAGVRGPAEAWRCPPCGKLAGPEPARSPGHQPLEAAVAAPPLDVVQKPCLAGLNEDTSSSHTPAPRAGVLAHFSSDVLRSLLCQGLVAAPRVSSIPSVSASAPWPFHLGRRQDATPSGGHPPPCDFLCLS